MMKETSNFSLKNQYIKLNNSNRIYNLSLPIIALTGGIASGKTSVSTFLQEKGLFVICADKIIKAIYSRQSTTDFIKQVCPRAYEQGTINFSILKKNFFENEKIKIEIENFLYAQMEELFLAEINKSQNISLIIYDVPLLFEKQLNIKTDLSICVYCSKTVQKKRIKERDNIENDLIEKIISSQIDIEEKKKLSDFIIDNSSDFSHLETETIRTFQKILTPKFS